MRSSRETSPHRDFSTLELRTPSDDLSCLLLLVGWQILSSRSQLYWSYVSYVLMSTIVESGIRQRIPFAPTTWLDDAFALGSGARLTCESVGSCVRAVIHGSHPWGDKITLQVRISGDLNVIGRRTRVVADDGGREKSVAGLANPVLPLLR